MKLNVDKYKFIVKTIQIAKENQPNRKVDDIINEIAVVCGVPLLAAYILYKDNIGTDEIIENAIISLTEFYKYEIIREDKD